MSTHQNPFAALLNEQHNVTSLEEHRYLKNKINALLPVAKQVLERLNQSEDLYLGAKAIELLAEGI
jgi:hypothetical protein